MNDSLFVRRFERVRDLLRSRQRFSDGDRPARDTLLQVLALDEFHDEGAHTAGLFQAVDVGNVGMVEGGERVRFAGESREPIRIIGEGVGQNLQRHVAMELGVAGSIHLPHATFTELRGNFVDAEAGTGSEGQTLVVDYTGGGAARAGYS